MLMIFRLGALGALVLGLAGCGGGSSSGPVGASQSIPKQSVSDPLAAPQSGESVATPLEPVAPVTPPIVPIAISTTTADRDPNGGIRVDNTWPDKVIMTGASGINDVIYYVSLNDTPRMVASGFAGLPEGMYTDGTSTLYSASFANDGASFAVAGHQPGSQALGPGQFLGGYIRALGGPPSAASGSYTGIYNGYMADVGGTPNVFGLATVDADFAGGLFSAEITRRALTGDAGAFNAPVVQGDVAFAGTIDGAGLLRGGHDDGNSFGSLTGQAHPSGVVGIVEITHAGAGTAAAPSPNAVEVGTFAAE